MRNTRNALRQVKAYPVIGSDGGPDRVPITSAWFEPGKGGRQTSLVVDPPDGRIPALTPEAQKQETRLPSSSPDS